MQLTNSIERAYPSWTLKDIMRVSIQSAIISVIVLTFLAITLISLGVEHNFFVFVGENMLVYLVVISCIYYNVTKKHKESFVSSIRIRIPQNFNLFLAILIGIIIWYVIKIFPSHDAAIPQIDKVMAWKFNYFLIYLLIGLTISPIAEEIIWRGYVYPAFKYKLGAVPAILAVSILFSLVHVPALWGAWKYIFFNLLLSFTLSILRETTDSTLASIVCHLSYNAAVAIAVLSHMPGK